MSTHRYACDVLRELREVVKTLRFDRVPGLIEELQTMFNRMESKLYSYQDIGYDLDRARDLHDTIDALEKTAKKIEAKLAEED
jgi:hypothetical protein